jgi:hypothetical protein
MWTLERRLMIRFLLLWPAKEKNNQQMKMKNQPEFIIVTRASMYSTRRSRVVSFSFKVANRDRQDRSAKVSLCQWTLLLSCSYRSAHHTWYIMRAFRLVSERNKNRKQDEIDNDVIKYRPKLFKKSEIFLMLPDMTSIYSLLAQSCCIWRWTNVICDWGSREAILVLDRDTGGVHIWATQN